MDGAYPKPLTLSKKRGTAYVGANNLIIIPQGVLETIPTQVREGRMWPED